MNVYLVIGLIATGTVVLGWAAMRVARWIERREQADAYYDPRIGDSILERHLDPGRHRHGRTS